MGTFLGLLGLVVFIVGVTTFAASVTYTVIKLSPARDKPKKPKSDAAAEG
jgi:hypothetical protein